MVLCIVGGLLRLAVPADIGTFEMSLKDFLYR